MISNSIILPTEQPVDIQDIKRALITYDKIYIASPDDRELIPSNTYQNALFASLGFPTMPFGMPDGPIKPLGKIDNHDAMFEEVLTLCKDALDQGSLEILSAPQYTQTATFGATPIPEDTPNPYLTYFNYRQISENPEFVKLMSYGLRELQLNKVRDIDSLLPAGRENEEQSVNDQRRPPKAILDSADLDKERAELISKMCHTRIGTLVKYLGYSFLKNLHPFTTDVGYANVISKLEFNFTGTIESIDTNEELLKRQRRLASLHNLIISEYVDPQKIDALNIKQILKLRTKAWGKTQENRQILMSDLNEIALDCESDDKFERACKIKFDAFLQTTEDYRHEIDKLRLMLLLDANILAYINHSDFQLLEKLLIAPSFETLLIVGGMGIQYAKQHLGTIMDILKKADERRITTGYGIYSNYKYLLH